MTMTTKPAESAQGLRQRAEEQYRMNKGTTSQPLTPEETEYLLQELRVHQIQLEMQNEELRRAHEELDASQSRYFNLYDMAPVGYLTISAKRMIKEVNLTAATMLGVVRDLLVKEPIGTILPMEGQHLFYQHLRECREAGESKELEIRLARSDGALFWAHLQVTPAQNGEYWITMTNIAARKQIEQDLIESEFRWKFALEGAGDGTWDWNLQTGEAFYSRRYKEMLGFAENEIGNRSDEWLKRVHPEDALGVMIVLQPYLDGKTGSAQVEFRMLCKDGSLKWILGRGMVVNRDDYGKPLRMIGTNTDISERKRMEESLKVSNERYRFSLEVTGQIGWSTPPDGVAEDLPLWRQYSGQTLEEVKGWKWLDAVHPDDRESAYKAWSSAAAQKCDYAAEYRIRRADGVYRNFLARGIPLLNDDGSCREWVGTCIDITELKLTEQALLAKNTELERFAYTVSHDLKSPLITIQAYAGMIKKDLETGKYERAQDDMKRIEGAADKMTSLLNDILELSRAGKMINEPSPVDMNRLVKHTLLQLAGPIAASHTEIVLHPDLPSVLGDEKRITEVVQNLIENAIKYMGDQAVPRIEIGTRQEGKECVFFVSDNGKGIDPRHHEKVFGLFNKLDAESEGTGIGLALVKRIIEVHGGKVWVESEGEGKGSRFCFTIKEAQQ